ncbi:hypothetical protein WJX74_003611 [Apatococcus lobatus]|uniref:Dolichyl-diphosphooligosaccharide-protein glycosyltransferase subunit OST5 n=1 Tax=Apatococcus lobatus TaxID=904363 RepID=A0AAW1RLL6_9CHLO
MSKALGLQPLDSPIAEGWYPTLAVLLILAGLGSTASFFVYEVTTTKFSRNLRRELSLSIVASLFLGFGLLFLLLWTGVYV